MNSICDQRINEWALGVVNGFVGEWSKVRLPVRELNGVVILPHCLCDFGPSCPLCGVQQLPTWTHPYVVNAPVSQ